MPYITTQDVKEIRNNLKKAFPQFKFAVRREHYSSVNVNVMAGPIDFGTGYEGVNHYWLDTNYGDNPQVLAFLKKVKDIVGGNVYEVTYDGDYGSIPNYYYSITIGKWDRPYVIKK
jgi:hypothetical protein